MAKSTNKKPNKENTENSLKATNNQDNTGNDESVYSKKTLFIRNLPKSTTSSELALFLNKYGKLRSCYGVESKGIAFAQFETEESCREALKELPSREMAGTVLKAELAIRKNTPRTTNAKEYRLIAFVPRGVTKEEFEKHVKSVGNVEEMKYVNETIFIQYEKKEGAERLLESTLNGKKIKAKYAKSKKDYAKEVESNKENSVGKKDKSLVGKKNNSLAKKDNSLINKDNSLAKKDNSLAKKDNSLVGKKEVCDTKKTDNGKHKKDESMESSKKNTTNQDKSKQNTPQTFHLLVSNLPQASTVEELTEFLSTYGELESCEVNGRVAQVSFKDKLSRLKCLNDPEPILRNKPLVIRQPRIKVVEEKPRRRLCVRNMDKWISKNRMRVLAKKLLKNAKVKPDIAAVKVCMGDNNKNRGFGFVEFRSEESARIVCQEKNASIFGKNATIEFATEEE